MKKDLFLLFALLCTVTFFTACSDDDNVKGPSATDVNASYTGNQLVLTYSDSKMVGKTVDFLTSDGASASLTLKNVIPGESSISLSNVALKPSADGTNYLFEGTEDKNGCKIEYNGTVEKGKLELALNVTMPTNDLLGKWYLLPIIADEDNWGGANLQQCLIFNWESDYVFKVEVDYGFGPMEAEYPAKALASMFGGVGSSYLENDELLQDVSFLADGNIVATYSPSLEEVQSVKSPLNLAQYYIKDSKLYLLINVDMIEGLSATPAARTENPLELLQQYLSAGIPLNYTVDKTTGTMKAYVNKDFVTPFSSLVPMLANMLPSDAGDFSSYMPMVKAILTNFPAAMAKTTSMEIGLALTKTVPSVKTEE